MSPYSQRNSLWWLAFDIGGERRRFSGRDSLALKDFVIDTFLEENEHGGVEIYPPRSILKWQHGLRHRGAGSGLTERLPDSEVCSSAWRVGIVSAQMDPLRTRDPLNAELPQRGRN
jgi:hypothetical protein